MEINLNQIELGTLYLHLKEWLDENENEQDSSLPEVSGKWYCLEHIYSKLKSKI